MTSWTFKFLNSTYSHDNHHDSHHHGHWHHGHWHHGHRPHCPDPIPCFTPGTRFIAAQGPMQVENVKIGDRLLTRDSGMQTVIWVGYRDLSLAELIANPSLRPIHIARDSLGDGLPVRDMMVSPQHRFLVRGADLELQSGEYEMLVPAKALLGRPGITMAMQPTRYIHVLFERHEVVLSDDTWTESFQPAAKMVDSMDRKVQSELLSLFPCLQNSSAHAFDAARATLAPHELNRSFEIG
ncbi:Hint domain-containing protein [Pacificibacter maritimus]|uniref:Hint domain-containing protein n=1 Tax=Pacificibacter maritimus TaxID=762213 RepID=A0A3N4UQ48_9RHOB|nr:Hint domain-containing protein [Pacificibacter maritimus]RPE72188.1 Hint domain-containing protein [Pacificibacter maritimus]